MSQTTSSFAHRLKEARIKQCISQAELSRISGIAAAQISRYEKSKSNPHAYVVSRLANALKVAPDWLLSGKDETTNASFLSTAQPGLGKRMSITLQQDTWHWFKSTHPAIVMRIEALIGNDEMVWHIDAFLRGYMIAVGLSMDSRDSILANLRQNYWSKS